MSRSGIRQNFVRPVTALDPRISTALARPLRLWLLCRTAEREKWVFWEKLEIGSWCGAATRKGEGERLGVGRGVPAEPQLRKPPRLSMAGLTPFLP